MTAQTSKADDGEDKLRQLIQQYCPIMAPGIVSDFVVAIRQDYLTKQEVSAALTEIMYGTSVDHMTPVGAYNSAIIDVRSKLSLDSTQGDGREG